MVAAAIGLALSGAGIALPGPLTAILELLGDALVPCMLFSAGLFLAACSFSEARAEIGWLVAVKLLIHPLITWWLAVAVFALPGHLQP